MTTPVKGSPELDVSQASKEATVNEQARRAEQGGDYYVVADKDLTAPPGSCVDGACYIVAGSPTGAWAGKATHLAVSVGANAANGWYFIMPREGTRAYLQDENGDYRFDGAVWGAYSPGVGTLALDDLVDVNTAGVGDGDLLAYDAASPSGWRVVPAPSAGALVLDDLTDVFAAHPSNGDVLTYDSSSPTGWHAKPAGSISLDQLTDVDTSSSPAPADGDVLTYNSATGLWIPGTPHIPFEFEVACSDEGTALTAGTNKIKFRMPCAVVLQEVRASLSTAQTSGGQLTVDINESGSTILSTKLIFDNTATTTVGSSPSAVISDTALADNAEISVDIDNVGDGTAKGLKVLLKGYRA